MVCACKTQSCRKRHIKRSDEYVKPSEQDHMNSWAQSKQYLRPVLHYKECRKNQSALCLLHFLRYSISHSLSNKHVKILLLVLHSQRWCIFHFTLDCKNVTVEQVLAESNDAGFPICNCIMQSRDVVIVQVEIISYYELGLKSWLSGLG